MGFLELKPQRQHYSRYYGHFFVTGTATFCAAPVESNYSTRRSIVDLLERLLLLLTSNFDSFLALIFFHHEIANLLEEKCQKSGKKYGVICCACCSTFVASLLKNSLIGSKLMTLDLLAYFWILESL